MPLSNPHERGHPSGSVAPGSVRYRLTANTLLLPFCPACDLDRDKRRRAGMTLARAVETAGVAWVDPAPLAVLCCSRPAGGRLWHHLGGPLPYGPIDDPTSTCPAGGTPAPGASPRTPTPPPPTSTAPPAP